MDREPFDVNTRPDRFATSDEIRSALAFFPDIFVDGRNDGWEIASDLGGYVRIELDDGDSLALVADLAGIDN